MANFFFSPSPVARDKGIALIRITIGMLMIYHGVEVFNPETMKGYQEWDTFKGSSAAFMVYAGKSSELLSGVFLFLGLFTRLGAIMLAGTCLYITFFVGEGRFWYQDQHPFMFVLFGVLFLFTGPGTWSADHLLFNKK